MLDLIRRTVTTLIGGGMILYLGYLLTQSTTIVQADYQSINILMYLMLILILAYVIVFYGIYPLYHRMQKRTLFVVGLTLILTGHYIFANDYMMYLYIGDMIKIIGVLIVWFGATGLMTADSIKTEKKQKSIEIIEA